MAPLPDEATSRARLYLIGPPALYADRETPERFAEWLEAAAAARIDIACLRLPAPPAGFPLDRARALFRRAQAAGIAVLVEDDLDIALKLGADGLHARETEAPIGELRRALGPDRSLGASCGLSRHAALEAAEAGADYVSFEGENDDEALLEVVAWWADVMTPPVVAEGFRSTEAAVALAEAGADFLALPVALPADARDHAVLRELSLALGEIGAEP